MSCTTGILPDPPEEIRITLPAGMELVSLPNPVGIVGTDFAVVQSVMAQLGPALAGFQVVLRIVDAVTAIFTVLERAPEIPTDPAGFIEALQEATQKVARLSSIVPQVSVPAMVLDTVSACAKYLTAIIDQLVDIAEKGTDAQAVKTAAIAAGDTELQAEAQCALDNVEKLTAHAAAALGPITGVLQSLTALMSFLPSPASLPEMPDASGMTAQQLADALAPIVEVLEAISL